MKLQKIPNNMGDTIVGKIDRDIIKLIEGAASVAIFPHVSADGDALGSSFALALALDTMGKQVVVYLEESIPNMYKFLPGINFSRLMEQQEEETYDLNIALDTGDINRIASRSSIFFKSPATINIDHHVTNTKFAHLNHVDVESASTGEIVFSLLQQLKAPLTKDIATCLYTAISTDTGGFKYGNTTEQTHLIAAKLLSTGIDIAELSQKIFDNTTFAKLQLTKKAIEVLELHENKTIAVIPISLDDFKKTGAIDEDCDGIVNIGRSIEGVEVSIMLKEKGNDEIKINFRSKTYVDVSEIAGEFGGGGHKRAAGCTVSGNLEDIKIRVLDAIKEKL